MAIYYDAEAGEYAVSPDECPDCESPLYDTGCDAPGCNSRWCPECGAGCDLEWDGDNGKCAAALGAESEADYDARIDAERAAFGLSPLSEPGSDGQDAHVRAILAERREMEAGL